LLFHLHIPKTGGTSLFGVLSAAVSPRPWHLAMSVEELAVRTTGYGLLAGHFRWDTLSIFPEFPRVLVCLREPVEHALSLYGYWRANARKGVFSPQTQLDADETLARPVDDVVLDPTSRFRANLGMMTAFLAGSSDRAEGGGLDVARRNLESCAWVGTTATLDRDMGILPVVLGLPAGPATRQMVNPERPQRADLSPAALRSLEDLTASDRTLHDRALAIANEQWRRFG
jgi:hypothetical protein